MRKTPIILSIVVVTGLILTPFLPKKIAINPTPSAPKGLYLIEKFQKNNIKKGDYIIIPVPKAYQSLVVARRYLAANIPLLKQIVALEGDQICIEKSQVFINGSYKTTALKVDRRGRKMPELSGCFTLKSDQFFALMPANNSLDSRYFGALEFKNIIGIAHPFWLWSLEDKELEEWRK
ncbi:MAG: signal peptidase I [Opitutaceae bacterium]|nr:signal peptidase I [Opitutaceae bacterium]